MNEEIIRKYANLMKELDLTGIQIEEGGSVVRLERNAGPVVSPVMTAASIIPENNAVESSVFDEITSPMIGVFYAAPAENADPFVNVGDRIKKGDTLCIIESMKLMNEVTAERDGVIKEICVKNGNAVEFGTVLFRIGD